MKLTRNKKIYIVAAIGAGAVIITLLDKFYDIFKINPNLVWFWERAPFVVVPVAARFNQTPFTRPFAAAPIQVQIPPSSITAVNGTSVFGASTQTMQSFQGKYR